MSEDKLTWWKVSYIADGVDDYYETLAYNEADARYAIESALREEGNTQIALTGAWRLPDYKG